MANDNAKAPQYRLIHAQNRTRICNSNCGTACHVL